MEKFLQGRYFIYIVLSCALVGIISVIFGFKPLLVEGKWVYIILLIFAGYFFYDGLKTGSVWVKGSRSFADWKQAKWNHKRSKEESPIGYWGYMTIYGASIALSLFGLFLI